MCPIVTFDRPGITAEVLKPFWFSVVFSRLATIVGRCGGFYVILSSLWSISSLSAVSRCWLPQQYCICLSRRTCSFRQQQPRASAGLAAPPFKMATSFHVRSPACAMNTCCVYCQGACIRCPAPHSGSSGCGLFCARMSSDEEQDGAGRRGGRMAFTDQVQGVRPAGRDAATALG